MFKIALLVVLIALLALAAIAAKIKGKQPGAIPTKSRQPLTRNEQGMYWRLRETFPDAVVLAQVAFSALITSTREHRNRYSQKVADFVLLDRAMQVIAVIELDDASHKGREANDERRDQYLKTAGYRVLRFPRTPDVDALRAAISPPAPTEPPPPRMSRSVAAK
jgi:very-short-patch-repair endonuclease